MFESIARECYGLPENSLDTSELPPQVVQDWWEILENHRFELSDEESNQPTLPGDISSSEAYLSSLRHHIQTIRKIPPAEFDVLSEETFASDPLHETYRLFGSQSEQSPEAETPASSEDPSASDIKPEIKICLKLNPGDTPSGGALEVADEGEDSSEEQEQQATKPKPKIKLKFTLPPPPSSSSRRSRREVTSSSSTPPPALPSAPLSRTRGRRLPLSFLQSVTDIDVDHHHLTSPDDDTTSRDLSLETATTTTGEEVGEGDDENWIDEDDEEDFLDDQEAQEQLRTDHIADFLDEDEYDDRHHASHAKSNSSATSSSRKRRLSGEEGTPSGRGTVASQPKKAKQKLGPGALLRKKLSSMH
jgi:hypothetical protein